MELHRNDPGNAPFRHRDAVETLAGGDGLAVVGHHHELGLIDKASQDLDKTPDIGFVERRVELVEEAEGAGLDHVDREEERHGGERPFPAGQQGDVLQLLARRAGDDLDPRFQHVFLVHQHQSRRAAVEERLEHLLEVRVHPVERGPEHLRRGAVDLPDHVHELLFRIHEVLFLGREEGVAFFQFLELLDRNEVDGSHAFEPGPQFLDHGLGRVEGRLAFLPFRGRYPFEFFERGVVLRGKTVRLVLAAEFLFRETQIEPRLGFPQFLEAGSPGGKQ